MDEKEKNKEWFDQLSDRLREHEEPYEAGSWERFRSQHPQVTQPQRVGLFPLWIKYGAAGISAAALILIGLIFLWPASENLPEMASTEVDFSEEIIEPKLEVWEAPANSKGVEDRKEIADRSVVVSSEKVFTSRITPPINRPATDRTATELDGVIKKDDLALVNVITDRELTTLTTYDIQPIDRAAESVLNSKSHDAWSVGERLSALQGTPNETPSVIASSNQTGRWNMGLVLAPNMTTEQVNIGGGLAVAYRLNDKLSVQTGISLGHYGVNTQSFIPGTQASGPSSGAMDSPMAPPSGGTGSSGATGSADKDFESLTPAYHTRYLNSQTSRLLGMDIPIELKYEVSDRFYTVFGLSVFGVLEENRTNHFVDRINEPLTMDGSNNSYSVRTLYVDERASRHPMDGHTYTGFLNFSIGHQTQISRKLRFSVEPFFKLPIGSLAREDMNLTNGGIRIITGF